MMELTKREINQVIKVSKETALKVGKKLVGQQKKLHKLNISVKEAQGVVSEADIEAEEFIIKNLKKEFPDFQFLAEESCFKNFKSTKEATEKLGNVEWLWIIDPLDGTTNFLSGLDYYAVCISLAHRGVPVTGVVYRPHTGECFFAKRGEGAWMQNLKTSSRPKSLIQKKNKKKLKESLLVTGFATEKGEVLDREFSMFKGIMGHCRGIRRMGSAALDLCYVADGMFDAFWERNLAPWDVAAAGLICQEAGAKVSDYNGVAFHPFQETIVACRDPLRSEFLPYVKER